MVTDSRPLTAAIVGLGQVGSRLDEQERPMIWSHAGAYLSVPDIFTLVGGADIDVENRTRFRVRCPTAEIGADPAKLIASTRPDIVSVCTPPQVRRAVVESILAVHQPKVIICEKPLASSPSDRSAIVAACRAAGSKLVVNYNRRYITVYRRALAIIRDGSLGKVSSISVFAPNRLWSIGSHALDILLYIASEVPDEWRSIRLPLLDQGGEPACDFICRFPSGIAGRVLTVGWRDMVIVELNVFGEKGRLQASDPLGTLRWTSFDQARGQKELGEPRVLHTTQPSESAFVTLIREAADIVRGSALPSSSGENALASEALIDEIVAHHGK